MMFVTSRPVRAAATLSVTLSLVAACASTPVPDEKMAVAQASMQRAEQSGAPQLAPVELANARQDLTRAQKAAVDHDNRTQSDYAERADVDARLAEATAVQQKSRQAAVEFDASMQALRQESLRNTPATQ